MSSTKTPDYLPDSKSVVAKRGYSIWSLLVIMTLLAVVLAIPKSTLVDFSPVIRALFMGCHQFALWVLVGTLIWMLLGKRRVVLLLESIVFVVVWGPLFAVVMENLIGGNHRITRTALESLGLFDHYGQLYTWISSTFGYGSL